MQPLWKATWRFLRNLKIGLAFEAAIPLLEIYPKEMNQHKRKLSALFIIVQSIIDKIWNLHRWPSDDIWINKACYLYTAEYYSIIMKNKILSSKKKKRIQHCVKCHKMQSVWVKLTFWDLIIICSCFLYSWVTGFFFFFLFPICWNFYLLEI